MKFRVIYCVEMYSEDLLHLLSRRYFSTKRKAERVESYYMRKGFEVNVRKVDRCEWDNIRPEWVE